LMLNATRQIIDLRDDEVNSATVSVNSNTFRRCLQEPESGKLSDEDAFYNNLLSLKPIQVMEGFDDKIINIWRTDVENICLFKIVLDDLTSVRKWVTNARKLANHANAINVPVDDNHYLNLITQLAVNEEILTKLQKADDMKIMEKQKLKQQNIEKAAQQKTEAEQ